MLGAALTSLVMAALGQQTFGPPLEGISVPLRQDLSTQLNDAQEYLNQQRWAEAIPLLHELVSCPPSAVRQQSAEIYVGIASLAADLLRHLPAEAATWYRNNYQLEAAAVVANDSRPLNISRLEQDVLHYAGLAAADSAAEALNSAYRDRNFHEMYDDAPPPRRPIVMRDGMQFSWKFDFADRLPLKFNAHRLAFGNGMVYATNGHDVVALDAMTGSTRWEFDNSQWHDINENSDSEMHAAQSQFTILQPVLSDGVLLVNIHQAQAVGRSDKYRGIDIRHMTPLRRLYAFDALSGDLLWKQTLHTDGTPNALTTDITCGPPHVSAGRVFVPVYDAGGNVDVSLICYELYSGKQLYKTFLASGAMQTNLFGNLLTEVAMPAPVSNGEQVWVLSQLGTLSCIEARTGITKWTRTYPRTKVVLHQDGRVSQRVYSFSNNSIILHGDQLAIAPIDSRLLLVVDANSGKTLASYAAQDRMRFIIGFDGEYLTTSGNLVQQLSLRDPQFVRTSPQLYRYSGYSNENLISSRLSERFAWMPHENGVVAAPIDDLDKVQEIVAWGDSSLLARSPIQLNDGALYFLTRGGLSCYRSDSFKSVLEQDHSDITRRDLNYLMQVSDSDLSLTQSIYARTAQLIDSLSVRDKELAKLVMARCNLLREAKAPAITTLKGLQNSFDDEIAWQATVLLCEAQQRVSQSLLDDPQRSALLLNRSSVPAAALIAKISGDWASLLTLYLDAQNELLEQWLSELFEIKDNQKQLDLWLLKKFNEEQLFVEHTAVLYAIAHKFASTGFTAHSEILNERITVPSYRRLANAEGNSLPWHYTLLHAFSGNSGNLLFQSQRTLILVREGRTYNIRPFDSGLHLNSLSNKCVALRDGCVIFAAGLCIYFDNNGNYHITELGVELSPFGSPLVVGDLVLHSTFKLNGTGLALFEPRSGRLLWHQQVEQERSFKNELSVAGSTALYLTENSEVVTAIDLLHRQEVTSISKQQALAKIGATANTEVSLSVEATADGKPKVLVSGPSISESSIIFDELDFLQCIKRSFNAIATADGVILAFNSQDNASGRLLLHVVLLNSDGTVVDHHTVKWPPLNHANPNIFLLDNQVVVGGRNSYFLFQGK
ncbi:MAG: hypothetical protein ACI84O_000446 [Myxococcota bacterium]|jgi:hypothetical protein